MADWLEALIGRPFFLSNHYDDTQSPLLMIFPTFEAPFEKGKLVARFHFLQLFKLF